MILKWFGLDQDLALDISSQVQSPINRLSIIQNLCPLIDSSLIDVKMQLPKSTETNFMFQRDY